jgi:hypothetical protein
MKTNKTKLASIILKNAWKDLPVKQKKLEHCGPRGGKNSRYIPGWSHSPSSTVTKACHLAGIPTMDYWADFINPTPSTAIPTVLLKVAQKLS